MMQGEYLERRKEAVKRAFARAKETLGSREKAVRWLQKPNRALGNEVPLRFANTEVGAREVESVLGRIQHGVYS